MQEFATADQMFKALLDKKVDAVVTAAPLLLYYAAHEGKGRVKTVGPEFNTAPAAIMVQLDSPLRRKINLALIALRENGTYQQIYDKWFGSPLGRANLKWLRLQLVPSATVLGLLLSAVLAASAHAQQASTPAPSPSVMTDQQLAISVHNPFEDFVKVPIQSTTGFQLGRHHKVGDSCEHRAAISVLAECGLGPDGAAEPDLHLCAHSA